MKVTLKSAGLDLEVDDVKKLEEVLEFVKQFKDIEVQTEAAKTQINIDAAKALAEKPKRDKRKPKQD